MKCNHLTAGKNKKPKKTDMLTEVHRTHLELAVF